MSRACAICSQIPDFVAANLREGEKLPEAALRLVDAYPSPEGFWDTSKEYEITKKCPDCGQLYTYHYYYEFSVGCVEESVWLERAAIGDVKEPGNVTSDLTTD